MRHLPRAATVGHPPDDLDQVGLREAPADLGVRGGQASQVFPQHMVGCIPWLLCESGRVGEAVVPGVMEVERGAVVDDPEVVVPEQQVGVVPRSVDVRAERVEPQHPGGDLCVRGEVAVVAEGAGQEVDAEVDPDTGAEQVLHLLVGLVAGQVRPEVEEHLSWRAEPDPLGQARDDHLRDQHPQSLPGAAELADVGAEVVGLDDAGEAAALPERRDVAGDRDGRKTQQAQVFVVPAALFARRARRGVQESGSSSVSRRFSSATSKSASGHRRSIRSSASRRR
jgi:hypothetical protein